MIDQPSGPTTPSPSPVSHEPKPAIENGGGTPKKSKLRPARKAPPPPKMDTPSQSKIPVPGSKTPTLESKIPVQESKIPSPISKIPKKAIPVRSAPPVPTTATNIDAGTEVTDQQKDNFDDFNGYRIEPLTPLHDGLYDLLDLPEERDRKPKEDAESNNKPVIPKRYIKPKLVMIPRSQVNLPHDNEPSGRVEAQKSRPPPPPRPNPPKLGPIRAKLQAPRSPGYQTPSDDDETGFFHFKNQNNVNDFLRQDSSEPEFENNPYQSLSSFGSTFGKKEDVVNNSLWNKSPVISGNADRHKFGASFGKMEDMNQDMNRDIHTLNDTSPIVLNDIGNLQNHGFVVNSDDFANDDNFDFKYNENLDSIIPVDTEKFNDTDVQPNISPDSAQITVTPTSPKKKEKMSRLAPPKPVTLALESTTDQTDSDKSKLQDSGISQTTSSPGLSRIPRSGGTAEPVSKLPVTRKDTPPMKAEEIKQAQVTPNVRSPYTDIGDDEKVTQRVIDDNKPVVDNRVNSVDSPVKIVKDENDNRDDAHLDSGRERTDSFGIDKPPLAPKPKPKALPKLLPKPKAGLKPSAKESDTENVIPAEKESPKESSLPTTPVAKVTPEVEEKVKEDESKQSKKIPNVRGRKSGIPASPALKKKKLERLEKSPDASKVLEIGEPTGHVRNISESDSDAPLSPVTNIRRKPESPSGARRVKKGDTNLRNRSNSPHGRTGIPVNLKQRSNSPASKLPRSGIPKPNVASPSPTNTPTSNGPPSGLAQPKPIAVDQKVNSPSSGPSSPRVERTPSPEPVNDVHTQEQLSPKPERPSKPPQKQKSQDGKSKHGKSLLPVIHKNMDAAAAAAAQNGVAPSPGSKPKRGIPVARPPRPPGPKSPAESNENR